MIDGTETGPKEKYKLQPNLTVEKSSKAWCGTAVSVLIVDHKRELRCSHAVPSSLGAEAHTHTSRAKALQLTVG